MHLSPDTRFQNFIAGRWISGEAAKTANVNPSKPSEILGYVEEASPAQVRSAIESAGKAFLDWRRRPAPERGRIIGKAAQLLRQKREELATVMSREEGKLLREARGEVDKSLFLMEYYSGEGMRLSGETVPSEMPRTFTYTLRQPLGVVGLITPWNFPVSIPIWKICPALVAGNAVVFKPSPLTPGCAQIIVETFLEAGLPPEVLQLTHGNAAVGEVIVRSPECRAISFTGSTPVGFKVYQMAAVHGAKVTCEMGGKNAVIVLEDADLELAATGILQGGFGSTGQRCTATSRVIAHSSIRKELVELIIAGMSRFAPGDPFVETSGIGPAVSEAQLQKNLYYTGVAKDEGARLCAGGTRGEGEGYFFAPTLFDGVTPTMRIAKEEVFGPVLSILEANDFETALEIANSSEFGLTGSIYSRDPNAIMDFCERAEVGMAHINQPTIGGEAQLPFGGIKKSGIGDREMGKPGIEFFTELKTVFFDYTGAVRKTSIY
jgi:acyl-CoA reductase-like NAD-dependent aldehyde dehydrogenase